MAFLIVLLLELLLLLHAVAAIPDETTTAAATAAETPNPTTNLTLPIGPNTTDGSCGPDHNGSICILDGILPCCRYLIPSQCSNPILTPNPKPPANLLFSPPHSPKG